MKWICGLMVAAMLAACGVDGAPIRPSVTTTMGTGSGNTNASVTTEWISGSTSTNIGTSF